MNFADYVSSFDDEINKICIITCKKYKNSRIEFDDLKSEAILKLLELWEKGIDRQILISGKGLISTIKNHLIDYVRKFYRDALASSVTYDGQDIQESDTTTD